MAGDTLNDPDGPPPPYTSTKAPDSPLSLSESDTEDPAAPVDQERASSELPNPEDIMGNGIGNGVPPPNLVQFHIVTPLTASSTASDGPTPSKRPVGRPKGTGNSRRQNQLPATPPPASMSLTLAHEEFDTLIHILQPDAITKTGKGSKSRTMTKKVDPVPFGPFVTQLEPGTADWAGYLASIVAELDDVESTDQLRLSSMQWRQRTPANSVPSPLRTGAHFESMLKKLRKLKSNQHCDVIVTMDRPFPRREVDDGVVPSTSAPKRALETEVDADYHDDDEGPSSKKAKLQESLKETIAELHRRYPTQESAQEGEQWCTLHPDKHCFFHAPTKSHFDIGHQPRAIAWASYIKRGEADFTRVPLASAWFKPTSTMKKAMQPQSASPPVTQPPMPTTPVPNGNMQFAMSPQGFPPLYSVPFGYGQFGVPPAGYPFGFPPYPMAPYGALTPPTMQTPSGVAPSPTKSATSDLRSSPPPECDFEEFCRDIGVSEQVKGKLEKLQFEVDDNPHHTSASAYQAAGFTEHSWNSFVRKWDKYKKRVRTSRASASDVTM